MLYYIVLYCMVWYGIVLYCIVLYCIVLYCIYIGFVEWRVTHSISCDNYIVTSHSAGLNVS